MIRILLIIFLLAGLSCAGHSQSLDNIPARPRIEPTGSLMVSPAVLESNDTVKVCILGDIMMHTAQLRNALKPGEDTALHTSYTFDSFRFLEERLKAADLSIGNLEFTLAGPPFTGYPSFSAPDSYAEYLAESGIDVFLCANNHILDKGSTGAERTLETYRKMGRNYGISYTGCSSEGEESTSPLIMKVGKLDIALINLTYGTNAGKTRQWPEVNLMDARTLEKIFRSARKSGADVLIALPHWGIEYQLRHSAQQRSNAERMAEEGADLIIGAHPHVVQDKEVITAGERQVQVLYSLGNSVSNMSARNTQIGLLAEVEIIRKLNGKIEIPPIGLTWLWCSRPGGYDNGYTVIPIQEFIGKKDIWKNPGDYERMIASWYRVRKMTALN